MRKVKPYISVMIVCAMILAITGCEKKNHTSETTEEETATAEATTTTEEPKVSEFAQHVYDEYFYDVNGQDLCALYDFDEDGEYHHYWIDNASGEPDDDYDYDPSGKFELDEDEMTLTMYPDDHSIEASVWYYQEDLGGFRTELVYNEGNTEDGPGYIPAGYYAFVIMPAGEGGFKNTNFFAEREKYVPSPYDQTSEAEATTEAPVTEAPAESNNRGVLTSDQAYQSVVNYCIASNPSLKDMMGNDDYTLYWTISGPENDTYTVEYRSYTAAHIYYHVNINTGDVTTTEFVPGITDGEQPGNEHFNAWDYL